MRELLEAAVEEALRAGAKFAEARATNVFANRIEVRAGHVERVVPYIELAGSVRSLVRTWGFASTTRLDRDSMLKAAARSARMAKAASSAARHEVVLAEVPVAEEEVRMGDVVDPREVPIDEKLEVVLACDEAARAVDPRVVMTELRYEDRVVVRAFCNSEGTYVVETCPITQLRMLITAKEGANVQTVTGRLSAAAGQELLAYGDPLGMAERLAKRAVELLGAKKAPSGKTRVLVDNSIAALLALCVGTLASAELAASPSSPMGIFYGKLGQQVAAECLTITDDPRAEGLTVAMCYDDEGVRAKPARVVEKGRLVSYLHSRATAASQGQEANGRARAPSALFMPMPLNTNTIIEPGDRVFEELLEELKDGLYLVGLVGATVGRVVHCDCEGAYEVRGGELGQPYRAASFTLDLGRDLLKVEAVGSDFDVVSLTLTSGELYYPICGGAPHLLFSEVAVR
mgnify:CR=1 FL=1